MHVVFVSCCEKNAIKRTRAILDSYARRTGDRAWLTPITQEGLSELYKALRRKATRQTSVACFRNDGMKRMRLLWIVGNNKNFDKKGVSPIAARRKKNRSTMPDWGKICALIAETAGFMHDLGKFNEEFQNKLEPSGNIRDNVRHEWLSMFLADRLIADESWETAVKNVVHNPKKFSEISEDNTLVFEKNLGSVLDVLLFCIATHHKLPCKPKYNNVITDEHHVNRKNNPHFDNPQIPYAPTEKLLKLIQHNLKKLKALGKHEDNPVYWRAMAIMSRMALILADQSISAEDRTCIKQAETITVYANTYNKKPNQDLSWHLEHVGYKASQMIYHMLNIPLPSLSQEAIDRINQPSSGRYAWQNRAAFALSASKNKHDVPYLVLNIAGTGSGKTRMNLRAIVALNEEKPIRVATALNLRTLTLQTGDAYQQQLGIREDEMACVIGDTLAQKLHECGLANVDEDESEEGLDVQSDFDFIMPAWLKFYSGKNPKLGDIIGAPLLVSTIDFLVAAGEPHRKHHHILAAMRLMHSDLVLDEIDSYDPKPLLAVLRLVTVSAMFGRNVIASSATLSKPIAKMLWEAYEHGAKMRELLNNEPVSFNTAVIDDISEPTIVVGKDSENFVRHYTGHVQEMINKLGGKAYRIPELAEISPKNIDEWFKTIEQWTDTLHDAHAFKDEVSGKRLSFGLVRIANINVAVEVAGFLAKKIPNAKIVCYHSNHFPIQRFHIEQRLDFLLTRKGSAPNQHILVDKEIRQILNEAKTDVLFIVIATPVEEIGRDHDFDWAIIEPSSSQSIVQTAGRVNRHRLTLISKPNVAILQYCYREINNENNEKKVFIRPGLEDEKQDGSPTHPSHDLGNLFDWSQLKQIDAGMRFCSDIHLFAKYDDDAIEMQSKEIFKSMLTGDKLWMAKETYTESSLRSSEPTLELQLIEPNNVEKYFLSSIDFKSNEKEEVNILESTPRVANDWLIKTPYELIEYAEALGIYNDRTMMVSMSYWLDKDKKPAKFVTEKVCYHRSFGFYSINKNHT